MFSFFRKIMKNNEAATQEKSSPALKLQKEFVKKLSAGIDFKWDKLNLHFEYYTQDSGQHIELFQAHYYKGNSKDQFSPTIDAIDTLIDLQKEMSKEGSEPWTWVIFTLDRKGKYNFDFKYGIPPFVEERLNLRKNSRKQRSQKPVQSKSLITQDLPGPMEFRGGWAALAAVYAARGWGDLVYATSDQWLYHDGGGNWACMRFKEKDKVVLIGHDHEYSETYYGEAAAYFDEEETDLLAGAPEWWMFDLNPAPFGEWIGFIYGWDGQKWQRANYDLPDGFESIGLLDACSFSDTNLLKGAAADAPGLNGQSPDPVALKALVAANANITLTLLEAVVPGWNIEAGVTAALKFRDIE